MTSTWPMSREPVPREQALAAFAEKLAAEVVRLHRAGKLQPLPDSPDSDRTGG